MQSSSAPATILGQVKAQFSSEILQALPSDATLSRTIRRRRQPLGMKNPQTREDICLTEAQKLDISGNVQFLFKDSEDEKRIRFSLNLRTFA